MDTMKDSLKKLKIVPVVVVDDAKDMVPLAEALMKGGLPVAEITFRTAAAEEAIRLAAKQFPEMLIGAGTVLTPEQADKAIAAGAKFIVAPGFNPRVVDHVLSKGIPMFPGVNAPTQVEMALEKGLRVVKFFPAEPSGGLNMLKAIAAPYVDMEFMPTGGIGASNIMNYLAFKKVVACGGSWMVPADLVKKGDFAEIERLTREAVELVKNA